MQALVGAPLWASGPLADPWAGAESLVCLAGGQGSLGTHSRVRWKSLQELGHRLLNPLGLIQHQSKYPQGASSSLRPVGELQVGIGFHSTCEEEGLQTTDRHTPFCLLMSRTEPSDWKHGVFLQNACTLAWG